MLRTPATRTNPGRQRTSVTRSQPAPVRGWNTRDGIADMEPGFAVVLDNWFPMTAEIKMRKGSAEHVTDIVDGSLAAAEVETRSEEHTSELQSQSNLVCRLLLEKKN